MGCSACSKSKKVKNEDKNTNGGLYKTINSQKPAIFDSVWGKILYFSLCLILCITPIINLVCLFLFAKLIFSSKRKNDVKYIENGENDKDKNDS